MTHGDIGRRVLSRVGRGPAIGAVIIGVLLSVAAFWFARSEDDERVRAMLALRADWRNSNLAEKIADFGEALSGPAAFVAARSLRGEAFGKSEFDWVSNQARAAGDIPFRSISWAPRVTRAQLADFIESARRGGASDFRVFDQTPGGVGPAAEREEYFPVLFVTPFEGQRAPPGLTFDSDPEMRTAMMRARDEARPAATTVLRLFNSDEKEWAYFVFWPIYAQGRVPATVEERRAGLIGFVVGAYRLQAALSRAMRNTPGSLAAIRVFFASTASQATGEPQLLFKPGEPVAVLNRGAPAPTPWLRLRRDFQVMGQFWQLELDFSREAASALRSSAHWGWLLAGLVLTAAVASVLYGQGARRRAVETMVAARTAELNRANQKLTHEIDQRARSETLARDAGEMLQAVIEESPFAIVVIDPDRRVLLWNRSAERIFGYPAVEVVGRVYPLVPPEGQAEFDAIIARTASGERMRSVSVRRRRKDGSMIDVVFSGAPLFTENGSLRAMVFVLEDVTERRKIELQLQQAQRMESVGQLTGGIAHDFNNILGVVVGNLDLALERLAGDPATRELVEVSLKSALRGAELVRNLLAFSKRQPLAPRAIDLNERLPELSAMLRRTLGENIVVVTVAGKDLNPALADPTQVDSAILNLAINARDAMPKGGTLTIETANAYLDADYASLNPEVTPGEYVMIAVSDTGTGMPPEVVDRAFEPFYTTKEVGKGTGLGLAMIHGFAKQSKGHVKIYSELGIGTTVRLFLPRAQTEAGKSEAARAEAVPRGQETILVVEDNSGLRTAAVRLLGDLGYRVHEAENGPEAIRFLESGIVVGLVFTDIVMPGGMSGIDLGNIVVQRWPGVRVLFTTGFAEAAASNSRTIPAGAAVLSKPYRKAELARAIRRALESDPPRG